MLTGLELEGAGLSALGVLAVSAFGKWLEQRGQRRPAAASSVRLDAPPDESGGVQGRTPGVRESSGRGQGPGVLGATGKQGVSAWRNPPQPVVQMGAATQVEEFCRWMIEWEYTGTHTSDETIAFYASWARLGRIVTLPETIVLDMLAKHPCVERSRPRVKDPVTGRVKKTPGGTDIRVTCYTFSAVRVVVPTGVSAGPLAAPVLVGKATARKAKRLPESGVRKAA